jgi:hypothetical protein
MSRVYHVGVDRERGSEHNFLDSISESRVK